MDCVSEHNALVVEVCLKLRNVKSQPIHKPNRMVFSEQ